MYDFGLNALEISYFKSIPHFSDCDLAIRVSGDSMSPKHCAGDIVICKKIINHNYLAYGEIHLIVFADTYLLKYLHPHPTDKTLVLLKNTNEKFETMEVKRADLLEAYLVRGKMEVH